MPFSEKELSLLYELWYKYCSEITGQESKGASSWMPEIRNNEEDRKYIKNLLELADEQDFKDREIAKILQDLRSFSSLF